MKQDRLSFTSRAAVQAWARGLCLGLALCGAGSALAAAPTVRPNILLLVGDDWGYSDVGAYGGEMRTPNLDALARSGVQFSNFHVAASCSPTRAMLHTGVDNHLNGLGAMADLRTAEQRAQPGYEGHLNDRVVTVASLLRDNGYFTAIAGKWHLGEAPENLPGARGFERSFVMLDGGADNWEQRPWKPAEEGHWVEDGQPASLPEDFYSSTFIVDRTIDYIDQATQAGKPFFSYVAFQAIHMPVQAPRSFSEHYRGRYDAGWNALRAERQARAKALGLVPADSAMRPISMAPEWAALDTETRRDQARRMEVYAGMAEAADAEIGRLLDHLRANGQLDNTIILFLSDNGGEGLDPHAVPLFRWWLRGNYSERTEDLGDKGAFAFIGPGWASAAVSPLSTFKQWAGEGALRTPLIISGVPGMPAGRLEKSFAHVTDIMPTLLELAGVAAPKGEYDGRAVQPLRGRSMLPLLQGKAQQLYAADQPVGYELHGNAALFRGDFKLVKNLPPMGDGQWHLYDIRRDPGEVHDLRDARAELFAALQADYRQYAEANQVVPVPDDYDYRQQGVVNSLRSLLFRYAPWGGAGLAGLVLLVWLYRRRRRG